MDLISKLKARVFQKPVSDGIHEQMLKTWSCRFLFRFLAVVVIAWHSLDWAGAREYQLGFDEPQTSWRIVKNDLIAVPVHQRSSSLRFEGAAAELIQLSTSATEQVVILEHDLPASRVIIDELKLKLAVRATQPGAQIGLRIVLPRTIDPATGEPLVKHILGDTLLEPDRWKTLSCKTVNEEMARLQVLWRAQHKGLVIDTRDLFVDRVYLHIPISQGISEIIIDALRFGPIVEAQYAQDQLEQTPRSHVALRADRLYVDDAPFFPLILPSHGESIDQLQQTRANVIFTPSLESSDEIRRYQSAGLWTTTTPPCLRDAQGKILPASYTHRSLTDGIPEGILFWTLGTRIEQQDRSDVLSWIDQIHASQPEIERPIFADISSGVDLYSKDLDFLGISRHILQTSVSFEDYRDDLIRKATIAAPDALRITWVQTDPHPILTRNRPLAMMPLMLEPEQIKLQVYSALASGVRGIGYWKQTPLAPVSNLNLEDLDDTVLADSNTLERDLMIRLINLEMELLNVFLATGDRVGKIPVKLETTDDQELVKSVTQIQATIIKSPHAQLILPIWYGADAQYVPAPLVARNGKMIIPAVSESSVAWEISPTSVDARSTQLPRVAGGKELSLNLLDMSASILITSDLSMREQLQRKVSQLRQPAAQVTIELARLKYARTKQVVEKLQTQTSIPGSIWTLLNYEIPNSLAQAQANFQSEQYHSARIKAQEAMQVTRYVQYLLWTRAVDTLTQPASTLHTLCFQTLPDFWELNSRLSAIDPQTFQQVLTSGDFEQTQTMLDEGWERIQSPRQDVNIIGELMYQQGHQGDFALRMAAYPVQKDGFVSIQDSLIRLISPSVEVQPGETVVLDGWIKINNSLAPSENAFRIYDNQTGSVAALRFDHGSEWKEFRLIRQIHEPSEFFAIFDLSALGDVLIDDVKMKIIPATTPNAVEPEPTQTPLKPEEKLGRLPAWDLLNHLPKRQ